MTAENKHSEDLNESKLIGFTAKKPGKWRRHALQQSLFRAWT